MIERGNTIDEIIDYYDSLEEWAKPVHSMDTPLNYLLEEKRKASESDVPLTYEYDIAISSMKAMNCVILPFFNLEKRIKVQIHRMADWGTISLRKTGYKLLPLETIFGTLRQISPEKRETIFRSCSFSYNVLVKLQSSLEENSITDFISTMGETRDVGFISDVCQEYGIVDPPLMPDWEDVVSDMDSIKMKELLNLSPKQLNDKRPLSNDKSDKGQVLINIAGKIYSILIDHIENDLESYPDDYFTDREMEMFANIVKRPEGKVFRYLYKTYLEAHTGPSILEPLPGVPEEGMPMIQNEKQDDGKYHFEWPSWDDFNNRTTVGIPPRFEFITKHVKAVEEDLKNPEGYEHFKGFMNLVAEYGSIDNDTDMKTLLQFVTGKAFEGSTMRIRWKADNYLGRTLFLVVQWISDDNDKLGMTARMTEFYFESGKEDEGLTNPSQFLQRAKQIDKGILKKLHDQYSFFPSTKAEAKTKRK
ncbi:MAG: hypothetical protein IKW89_02505 [Bacteroidales bacterium]|nr:hypothetical protein [Bacteroidales bacterium]